jgi:hypothetical protein
MPFQQLTLWLVSILRVDARENIPRDAVFGWRAFSPQRQPEHASRRSDGNKNTSEHCARHGELQDALILAYADERLGGVRYRTYGRANR